MSKVVLSFRGDDLVVYDKTVLNLLPSNWKRQIIVDKRIHAIRLPPRYFQELRDLLERRGIEIEIRFSTDFSLSNKIEVKFEPRSYQREAMKKWFLAGNRGVVFEGIGTTCQTMNGSIDAVGDVRWVGTSWSSA